MKKLITVCQILVVITVVSAVLAYGDVIKGNFSEITLGGTKITSWDNVPGGSGTDNASDLITGVVAKARGGFGANVSAISGIPVFTTGYISWKTFTQFLAFIGVTFNPADNTWHFLAPSRFTGNVVFDNEITVQQLNTTCSYGDNTCGFNASNLGPPTSPVDGDCFYDNTAKALKCWSGAAWVSTSGSGYSYYKGPISEPVAGDNSVFDGPLPSAQVWDNVLFLVQDATGKLSGSSADNVTLNFSYCSSISAPTCTNVFTSDQTPTGAAILSPTINNSTPQAGDYIRLSIGTSNMTGKKLYVRVKYHGGTD